MLKKLNLFFICLSLLLTTNTTFSKLTKETQTLESVMKYLHNNTPLVPTKVFDNLYCIGSVSVVCWALKTNEGIILIDSMWDDNDAKVIETGMKSLGLNPKDIKYIIITHGHGDHYGGANYLRNKYGAKVVMTKTDETLMNTVNTGANSPRSPKTKVDIYANDKDKIKLGENEVLLLETPGHTPGGLSLIFPIKYKSEQIVATLWGGTGIPKEKDLQLKYKNSVEYFIKTATDMGAKVALTAHLFDDNGYENLNKVKNLKNNQQNPFILGEEGMKNYYNRLITSINKKLESPSQN